MLWNIIVWNLVVAVEMFVTALIVAPRWVMAKLRSLGRRLLARVDATVTGLIGRRSTEAVSRRTPR